MANASPHNAIHKIILAETQDRFEHNIDPDTRLRILFKNFRKVNGLTYGLRLSATGQKVLSRIFTCWEFDHNRLSNNKTLIDLDTHMTWPYYIGRGHVVFYNELDAAMFRLNGGELSTITEII